MDVNRLTGYFNKEWLLMYKDYELRGAWGTYLFKGRYLRKLESKNWHYYEREDGTVVHLHKSGSHFVIGDTIEGVQHNKPSPPPRPSEEVIPILKGC